MTGNRQNETGPGGIALTILGSGTCVPSLRRSACSVLMRIAGRSLLFDCGPGTMRRLLEAGVTIFDIDVIFFSHLHPDHSGELVTFLFGAKYGGGPSPRRPLALVAGKGFSDFFERLRGVYGQWIDPGEEGLKIVELDGGRSEEFRIDDIGVRCAPAAHIDSSLAYRVAAPGGGTAVYSGDTDVSDAVVELAKGVDLFICESALPDEHKVSGHLTPSLAGEMAARAGVGRLVLTHFYPECDAVNIAAQCRKTYDGPLVLAEDLLRLTV